MHLASNDIKRIEGLSKLKHLKVLELGFNKIEVIAVNLILFKSLVHGVFKSTIISGKTLAGKKSN